MNEHKTHTAEEASSGTLWTYISGFLLSLMLTLTAYFLVQRHVSSHHTVIADNTLIFMVIGLAVTQLLVQMVFFLHLDTESKPRWNLMAALFAATVLFIVVLGSLWIMHNLGYHHPSQEQINKYVQSQDGL